MRAEAVADAFPSAALNPAQLLDVEVDELAGPLVLVADGRIESAIPNASAISTAVKRSRRSARIASTRSAGVRFQTRRGADDRSESPDSPSSR